MTCGCGKPDCNGKCGKSPAVLQINNPSQLVTFHKVLLPAAMGDDETNPPVPGKYRNVLLEYEANGHLYLYSSDGIPTRLSGGGEEGALDYNALINKPSLEGNELIGNLSFDELDIATKTEVSEVDQNLQQQIDAIAASSDVVDVVGTYAQLQAYDTSTLHNNDIIKVLQDETHDDAISYYRWNTSTNTFSYVGSQGPFYTKSESDSRFVPQARTINGKALSSNITLTPSDIGAAGSYDASWLLSYIDLAAPASDVAALVTAIGDNDRMFVAIPGDDEVYEVVSASISSGSNDIALTLELSTVEGSGSSAYPIHNVARFYIDGTTRVVTLETATFDPATKADYGFYGIISGTSANPTDGANLAPGVYKASENQNTSYINLLMEDGTTKRQSVAKGGIVIRTVSRLIVLGTQNLMYQYNTSDDYFYEGEPIVESVLRREYDDGVASLGTVSPPNTIYITTPINTLDAELNTGETGHERITFTVEDGIAAGDFDLNITHASGDDVIWQDGKVPQPAAGETWIFEIYGKTIEPLRFSDTPISDTVAWADITGKPQLTYTGTSIASRVVTQVPITVTFDGNRSPEYYGQFGYIPLDMSDYTSGTGARALLPEEHLPAGAYVVTVAGYMRLGNESKLLQPGHIIFWDPDSGELDLIGYNACEYWSYDSQNDTWEGGYFTTSADVEYMIEEKMPNWVKISSGLFIVATKDPGYYTFDYQSASGTTRRIRINIEGTTEHYYPYNDTVLIKSENGVLMLGRFNLWFEYDSTNSYYKQPISIAQAFTGTDGTNAGTAGLVPAPAATDAGKFLKSDGTWATAGGGSSTPTFINDYLTLNTTTGEYTITAENYTALKALAAANTPLYMKADHIYFSTYGGSGDDPSQNTGVAPVIYRYEDVASGSGRVTLDVDLGTDSGLGAGAWRLIFDLSAMTLSRLQSDYSFPGFLFSLASSTTTTLDLSTLGGAYYVYVYLIRGAIYSGTIINLDDTGLGLGEGSASIVRGSEVVSGVRYQSASFEHDGTRYTVKWNLSGTTLTVLPLETESVLPDNLVYSDTGTATTPTPWIHTDDIQDDAVTADKIDWSTLYVSADTLSSDKSYAANTNTDVQTITLPAGKWRINWAVRGFYSATTLTTATAYLYQGSSSIQSVKANVPASTNTESTARFLIHNSYEITLSASATIKTVVSSANAGSVSAGSSYLYAMRVG